MSDLTDTRLHLINSLDDVLAFHEWLGRRRPKGDGISFDVESTGLNVRRDRVRLIQFGDGEDGWAFARDDWLGIAREVFRRYEGRLIGHNAPYDTSILHHSCGINVPRDQVDDTMVMSRVNEPHMSMGLKNQAARHVDPAAAGAQVEWQRSTGWTWETVPIDYEPYWCVPKSTEILTRTGWKKWDAITDQDETLGYEDDRLHWTPITGVHAPGVAPVVRFGNRHWSTVCTPNHRWIMRKGDDVGVYPLNEEWQRRKSVHLVRSAPAVGGSSSLTPNEAAILAWVLADGGFYWQRPETQSSPHVGICQSTKKYTDEIRALLTVEGCLSREWSHPRFRDQPDKIISFGVYGGYFTALWKKAGLDRYDVRSSAFRNSDISLIELVVSLTPEARAAWNDAWIKAEGTRGKNTLKQNRGPKLDAVMLSLYMDGYAVTASTWKRSDIKCVNVRYTQRDPTPQKTHYTLIGTADVWCPTTGNGTWTARDENGNIFVTGNTYGALDTVLTYKLDEYHLPVVRREAPRAYDLELSVQWVTERMQDYGVCVNVDEARRLHTEFTGYCERVETWCRDTYGIKPGSNADVIRVLESEGLTFSKATQTGAKALDVEVLGGIDHPLARAVLQRRQLQKMATTYVAHYADEADANELLYPSINTLGAKTSRMSMSNPNLQNLPRFGTTRAGDVVRGLVVSRYARGVPPDRYDPLKHGALVFCDFSQIEARLLAHMAGESAMIQAFGEGDFFVNLTRQIFDDPTVSKGDPRRQLTKNATYAILYGAGLPKFAKTAGITLDAARSFMNRWNQLYPGVRRFQNEVINGALELARVGEPCGTRSPLTDRWFIADNPSKAYSLVNFRVQGTAAEILKMKILELDAAGLGDFMVAPVHDEIILDLAGEHVLDAVHTLNKIMNDDRLLSVPITAEVSYGQTWGVKRHWENMIT